MLEAQETQCREWSKPPQQHKNSSLTNAWMENRKAAKDAEAK